MVEKKAKRKCINFHHNPRWQPQERVMSALCAYVGTYRPAVNNFKSL
jgi:hypothetical protein